MKKRIDPGYLISLLLSVVLAFAIGAVILAIAGFSPGKAYLAMLNGAFSSARHIGDLLEYAMVLCLCGLACVLGARASASSTSAARASSCSAPSSPVRSACGSTA